MFRSLTFIQPLRLYEFLLLLKQLGLGNLLWKNFNGRYVASHVEHLGTAVTAQ